MPKLSAIALRARIKQLQQQLEKAEANKRPAVRRVVALMNKLGVTLQDLRDHEASGTRTDARKRTTRAAPARKVAVKFRDAAGNSWSGRGRTPTWLVQAEAAGHSRDEFRVQK